MSGKINENIKYVIPTYKELCKLSEDNWYTERYDGVCSKFSQVPKSYTFILIINSEIGQDKYDGEWVRINGEWERPDGSVPLYARAYSSGALHP